MKKARSIRVSDALWFKVKLKARQEDKTVSQIVVDFLREYVKA
jgi:predicted transcriptional regulator